MFLAAAATLYVVTQDLPKTENLNRMDMLINSTLLVLFACALETMWLQTAYGGAFKEYNDERVESVSSETMALISDAVELDRIFSLALPSIYLAVNLWLFVPHLVIAQRKERRLKGVRPEGVPADRTWVEWSDIPKIDPWKTS
jgi:hypothetical protein